MEIEGKQPLLFGAAKLNLELDGIKYSVSPESFFQANWSLNRALVDLVLESLKPRQARPCSTSMQAVEIFRCPSPVWPGRWSRWRRGGLPSKTEKRT